MEKDILIYDSEYEDRCMCPYCKNVMDDAHDGMEDDGSREVECDACGLKFELHVTIQIQCETYKDCERNGLQHDFEKYGSHPDDKGQICKACQMVKFPPDPYSKESQPCQ